MNCEVWLLGKDNLFSQLGWSECAVSWADSFVLGCVTVVILAAIGALALAIPRGFDWLARKLAKPSN